MTGSSISEEEELYVGWAGQVKFHFPSQSVSVLSSVPGVFQVIFQVIPIKLLDYKHQ